MINSYIEVQSLKSSAGCPFRPVKDDQSYSVINPKKKKKFPNKMPCMSGDFVNYLFIYYFNGHIKEARYLKYILVSSQERRLTKYKFI